MRIDTVVVSTQHAPEVSHAEIREYVIEKVVKPVPARRSWSTAKITYHVNPTGRFVIGGPHGDCGLTGRKIIVDTYGGWARHGGGAFSGKDPTKVDRSAAYMARHVAKNIVAAGLADRCEVQLAYAIGVSDPVSVLVDTDGTGKVDDERLCEVVREALPADAQRDHQVPRSPPADLPADGRRRALRPQRAGVHLGEDRPGGGPLGRRGKERKGWLIHGASALRFPAVAMPARREPSLPDPRDLERPDWHPHCVYRPWARRVGSGFCQRHGCGDRGGGDIRGALDCLCREGDRTPPSRHVPWTGIGVGMAAGTHSRSICRPRRPASSRPCSWCRR